MRHPASLPTIVASAAATAYLEFGGFVTPAKVDGIEMVETVFLTAADLAEDAAVADVLKIRRRRVEKEMKRRLRIKSI